jgi:hypothetical protein
MDIMTAYANWCINSYLIVDTSWHIAVKLTQINLMKGVRNESGLE